MFNKCLLIIVLTFQLTTAISQPILEAANISYHTNASKTLRYLESSTIKSRFLTSVDSMVNKYLSYKISYPTNFSLKENSVAPKGIYSVLNNPLDPYLANKLSVKGNNKLEAPVSNIPANAYLFLDILELPIMYVLDNQDWDSVFIKQLNEKNSIAYYQFNLKIQGANKQMLVDKKLELVLSRNKQTSNIGFSHPDINLSAASFLILLESAMKILLDSTNDTELLQITAQPAIIADNFIQPKIRNQLKIYTVLKNSIIQYPRNGETQFLRYQEPNYTPIILKGKNQTIISTQLNEAIKEAKGRDYLFLKEESRDILADKNYSIQTVASIAYPNIVSANTLLENKKIGLSFQFIAGAHHYLFQDKDTIAKFSITTNVVDANNRKFLHQLAIPNDSMTISVSAIDKTVNHQYAYILNGELNSKPFKILYSGLNGNSESIREFYFNNKLVCIAQGNQFPEVFTVLDASISPLVLNQLLLLGFSSLF
jgi:hypothetical protein